MAKAKKRKSTNKQKRNVQSRSNNFNKSVAQNSKKQNVNSSLNDRGINKKADELNKKKAINKAKRELNYELSGSNEIVNLIKIVFIVTIIMAIFYVITSIATKKADDVLSDNEKASSATEIQYDSIIIGSMLKKNGTYFVLIEDPDDSRLSLYDTLIQTAKANDSDSIYTANLTDSFNKGYLSDKEDYSSDMRKFRVKGTTLVKVRNHKIADVYDTYDSIKEELEKLN